MEGEAAAFFPRNSTRSRKTWHNLNTAAGLMRCRDIALSHLLNVAGEQRKPRIAVPVAAPHSTWGRHLRSLASQCWAPHKVSGKNLRVSSPCCNRSSAGAATADAVTRSSRKRSRLKTPVAMLVVLFVGVAQHQPRGIRYFRTTQNVLPSGSASTT
jgi:hypothetical protein